MVLRPDLGYFDEGLNLTQPSAYAGTMLDFGTASPLPGVAYRSKVFAELEDEKIWTRSWVCIGTRQQIPEAGDILPFTVGNHGIHVERMPNGSLAARFNRAQHGGCRSVPLQCQTGRKTKCSYTSCGYSRDRDAITSSELRNGDTTQYQYLGLTPERLLPVRVEVWGPFIFVNLSDDTTPLACSTDLLAGLAKPVTDAQTRASPVQWLELQCNWKLAGDTCLALLESHHLDPDERRSVKAGNHSRDASPYHVGFDSGGSSGSQDDSSHTCSGSWLFPNLLLACSNGHVMAAILQPIAMDVCHVRWLTLSTQRAGVSDQPSAQPLEKWSGFWESVMPDARHAQKQAADRDPVRQACSNSKEIAQERSRFSYQLNRYLLARILQEHDRCWSAPLYRHAV